MEINERILCPLIFVVCEFCFYIQHAHIQLPSKLLIQVPRFGRRFKTYQKIIADLNLDIVHLTDSPSKHSETDM